jgi:hypothetical protein
VYTERSTKLGIYFYYAKTLSWMVTAVAPVLPCWQQDEFPFGNVASHDAPRWQNKGVRSSFCISFADRFHDVSLKKACGHDIPGIQHGHGGGPRILVLHFFCSFRATFSETSLLGAPHTTSPLGQRTIHRSRRTNERSKNRPRYNAKRLVDLPVVEFQELRQRFWVVSSPFCRPSICLVKMSRGMSDGRREGGIEDSLLPSEADVLKLVVIPGRSAQPQGKSSLPEQTLGSMVTQRGLRAPICRRPMLGGLWSLFDNRDWPRRRNSIPPNLPP